MAAAGIKIYGLIGFPVKHSLSAAMHNAAFAALKIKAEYRLFELAPRDLDGFLKGGIKVRDTQGEEFDAADVKGFNITIPHKVRAWEILRKPEANITGIEKEHYVFLSGAINTVKRMKGERIYQNTDAPGFVRSLKEDLGFGCRDRSVLIMGCGGAGRAVIAGLTWKDAGIKRIYVYDINSDAVVLAKRHLEQFDFVKDKLEFISAGEIPGKIKECQLLVNASPAGMEEGDGSAVDKSLLHGGLSVYDLVYNRETQLLQDAKACQLPCANGLGMLLYQGAAAFKLWTGKEAPLSAMRRALGSA
jgi:shikimate dehydrogenase